MLKCSYNDLVLVLVASLKTGSSWYKIERALDLRGLGGQVDSVEILEQLVYEGLLVEKKNHDTNLSDYQLTDQGEGRVRQLLDEYGTDIFLPKAQNLKNFKCS